MTGQLGSSISQLGQIQLAEVSVPSLIQSINEFLSFTQTVRGFNGTKILLTSLTFAQVASALKVYSRSTSNTLTFNQAADVIQLRTASNTFTINESATYLLTKGANTAFVISQTLAVNLTPHNETVVQTFTINQTAVGNRIVTVSATNTITYVENLIGVRIHLLSVSNTIAFNGTAVGNKLIQPNNVLTMSQSAVEHKVVSLNVNNTLVLSQSASRQATFVFSITQTLTFLSTHQKIAPNGSTLILPNLIVTKPDEIVVYQVPGQAVSFKPPLFGDSEGGKDKLIQQRTITGDQFTYVRRSVCRGLVYKFDIGSAKAEEFRGFIRNNLSNPMQLLNWKGEIWYGYIVNNPFITTSRNKRGPYDGEEFEIEVQFEGVQIH